MSKKLQTSKPNTDLALKLTERVTLARPAPPVTHSEPQDVVPKVIAYAPPPTKVTNATNVLPAMKSLLYQMAHISASRVHQNAAQTSVISKGHVRSNLTQKV